MTGIDGWPIACPVTNIIDDGVFEAQGSEFRMLDVAIGNSGENGKGLCWREEVFPGDFRRAFIQVFVRMTVEKQQRSQDSIDEMSLVINMV